MDEKLKDVFSIFIITLERRLRIKAERDNFTGWDDEIDYPNDEFKTRMAIKLFKKHPSAKDYLDIAAYALFLWARKKGLKTRQLLKEIR